jgi:hypothetical protein
MKLTMSDDRINPELSHVELDEAELSKVTAGKTNNPFATFGDIKGESTEKSHRDWISILQW